jgi:hypothetical protein
MAAFYQAFTVLRGTQPDPSSLLAQLRALDATAGVQHLPGTNAYTLKKATAWTGPQINAAQNVLETAPTATPELSAQAEIDAVGIALLALALMLLDEVNVLRTEINTLRAAVSPPLTPALPQRTPAQARAAWRTKAGTL